MKTTIVAVLLSFSILSEQTVADEIVVIGNGNVPKMDALTVQKVYTGKFTSVAGVQITPVGVKPGMTVRNLFLQEFLNQDEEKYTAYWTVRRHIGKGIPPAELESTSEVIDYILSTPGAVGYIGKTELKQGVNVVVGER